MTPTLNVNQRPCTCGGRASFRARTHEPFTMHLKHCPGDPILLTCPIPRSVVLQVAPGECNCPAKALPGASAPHRDYCPARPMRVACSIAGATWEESAPDPDSIEVRGYGFAQLGAVDGLAIARERWEFVKALVLGAPLLEVASVSTSRGVPLVKQRDAVYAAIADMVRHEHGALDAQRQAEKAFPYRQFHRAGAGSHEATPPSHARLEAYVEFLVEEVGKLP